MYFGAEPGTSSSAFWKCGNASAYFFSSYAFLPALKASFASSSLLRPGLTGSGFFSGSGFGTGLATGLAGSGFGVGAGLIGGVAGLAGAGTGLTGGAAG